jgi:hypothetical protein
MFVQNLFAYSLSSYKILPTNGSLVTTIKLKAKCRNHAAAMLLFDPKKSYIILSEDILKVKKRQSDPTTCHGGAWGERMYSSYSFLTSALDGGEWSASRPGRALPTVPIVQEAEWAPEPVWTQGLEEKSSASVGDRTPVIQSAVRHYTD